MRSRPSSKPQSRRPRNLIRGSAAALLFVVPAIGQQLLPQIRYGTHDWTVPISAEQNFAEYWADTKSPGDGITYNVGTIQVADTRPGFAFFSTQPAGPALFLGGGALASFGPLTPPSRRQVAILQFVNADQTLGQQIYFYGVLPGGTTSDRATNARGISVWAEDNPLDTRIVICGETFDPAIPLSQAAGGNPLASPTTSSGFIAVFRGDGTLLWTRHLFGTREGQSCAVTDVSVRCVRDAQNNIVEDVVTFCGISSHGNPAANGPLSTSREFPAPPGGLPCSNPAGGITDNGPGQWDGFVGRVTNVHTNPTPGSQVPRFLSIVGGANQDGLFGIAEIDENRFAVAGSTANSGAVGTGNATFPLTTATCLSQAAQYHLGVVLVFNNSTPPNGTFTLEQANEIGAVGTVQEPRHTVARDVFVHLNFDNPSFPPPPDRDMLVAVGSTDDPLATVSWAGPFTAPDAVLNGPTDGFVVTAWVKPWAAPLTGGFDPMAQTFRGGEGRDGLSGVQGWNEFPDHFVVSGFTEEGQGSFDFEVGSYYLEFVVVGGLTALTGGQVGGTLLDWPAAMGPTNATSSVTPAFVSADPNQPQTWDLGDPAGGGVCVDQRARVNVVGTTNSLPPGNFPTVSLGAVAARGRVVLFPPSPNDGARVVLDLLQAGAGRTDGTGQPVAAPIGPYPLANTTGGTTPFCALGRFGIRIGAPSPALQNMLILLEGRDPQPGDVDAIVVSRPTAGANLNLMAMQFGLPNQYAPPWIQVDGLEVWTTNNPVSIPVAASGPAPLRFVMAPLPAAPYAFTVQLVCFQPAATIPGGNAFAAPPCLPVVMTGNSASPALWISY